MNLTSSTHHSSSYKSVLLFESSKYDINDITYFDDLGNQVRIKDSIQNIKEIEGQETVLLESGKTILLEKIYRVDGETSPNYDGDFFKCDCV